ncbi:MAG: helix-turn-helix domain-containing protein [Caulobacterales bacterium]
MRELSEEELYEVVGGVRVADTSIMPALSTAAPPQAYLTPRQAQCLAWVAAGKTSAEIGEVLGLSPLSVDTYIKGACKSLGVRSRCEAATVAERRKFDDDGHEGQSPQDQAAHGEIK